MWYNRALLVVSFVLGCMCGAALERGEPGVAGTYALLALAGILLGGHLRGPASSS